VDAFVQTYAMLCNRFEITYSLPLSGIALAAVKLKVASDRGSVQGEVTMEPPIAPPAEAPAGAADPSNASVPVVPSAA
jgi:hypothetical protein